VKRAVTKGLELLISENNKKGKTSADASTRFSIDETAAAGTEQGSMQSSNSTKKRPNCSQTPIGCATASSSAGFSGLAPSNR